MLHRKFDADAERRQRAGGPESEKSHDYVESHDREIGRAKLDGKEAVGGKDAPALYFGSTKINNNFDVVDAVAKKTEKG